jgi:hypothetical protein
MSETAFSTSLDPLDVFEHVALLPCEDLAFNVRRDMELQAGVGDVSCFRVEFLECFVGGVVVLLDVREKALAERGEGLRAGGEFFEPVRA